MVSIDLPAVIEPGTGLKGTVTFENDTEGVFEDTVTFTSDAENASKLELSMVAESALPRLKRIPSPCISDYWMEEEIPTPHPFKCWKRRTKISDRNH